MSALPPDIKRQIENRRAALIYEAGLEGKTLNPAKAQRRAVAEIANLERQKRKPMTAHNIREDAKWVRDHVYGIARRLIGVKLDPANMSPAELMASKLLLPLPPEPDVPKPVVAKSRGQRFRLTPTAPPTPPPAQAVERFPLVYAGGGTSRAVNINGEFDYRYENEATRNWRRQQTENFR